ncbi:MAG TPA: hypothetical protein VNW06_10605 [Cytophagaceae bacterium]|jgi:hypothetical protein|nr:hypothetical protein [Cytophagaceae bacterium]
MSLEKLAYKLKKFESFTAKIYSTSIGLLRVLLISKKRNEFPVPTEDTCIVLGNGPSLKDSIEENEAIVKSKILFCVNHFSKSTYYSVYQPENYILLDPAFFKQKQNPLVIETFKAIKEATWKMNLFVPYIYKKDIDILDIKKKYTNINVVTYNYSILSGFEWINFFFYKRKLAMPQFYNVLGAAIFLSLNMGFKKIWVVGAEHSWFTEVEVDSDNNIFLRDKHFYDKGNSGERVFLKDPHHKGKVQMGVYFQYLSLSFMPYYVLEKYSKYLNASIYNASETSYIDAFERKKMKL